MVSNARLSEIGIEVAKTGVVAVAMYMSSRLLLPVLDSLYGPGSGIITTWWFTIAIILATMFIPIYLILTLYYYYYTSSE